MSLNLNFTKATALIAFVCIFSSCLKDQGNYQHFSDVTGSVVDYNGLKLVKLDGFIFISSEELQSYEDGDRLLVSFKINYDNQPNSPKYYIVTNVSSFKLDKKQSLNVPEIANDTLKNDTILSVNGCFMSQYLTEVLMTVSTSFYASNDYHRLYVAKYDQLQSNNDTLRLEYRHNAVNDGEKTKTRTNFTSFDISEYFRTMTEGQTKIVEIKFKNGNRPLYRFRYTKSLDSGI